jgi:hypothetical protein
MNFTKLTQNMRKPSLFGLSLVVFALSLALTSCAYERSAAYAYDNGGGANNYAAMYDANDLEEGRKVNTSAINSGSMSKTEFKSNMLVYTANLGIVVKDADTTVKSIAALATAQGGYVVNKSNSRITIRVESGKLDETIAQVTRMGKLDYKSVYTEDVSDRYSDTQIRLENAEKARARYLELLAKAENVQAALLVEKELERLNTEIDQLRGQMTKMEHDVRFSTITVNVTQKAKLGVLGYVFVGVWKGVSWLFVRG